jgi:hypothetical protein
MWNVHGHLFNYQTVPAEIYFGRHGLSKGAMKLIRRILEWVEKNGLPDDVEDVVSVAEKLLPLFGLDDEWDRLKYLIKLYYMPMSKLVVYYADVVMPNSGIDGMCVLIPNFQDKYTRDAVDIICACTKGNDKFKVFAPMQYVKRDDVFGVKYYPALEGPPDKQDWKEVADTGKPVTSHSSPGGVRNKRIPQELAVKYNAAGRWMDALDMYPIRLNLAHSGGRRAFVYWFAEAKCKPGFNWPYNNMMLTYNGFERPGKVFCDVAFHEDQTRSDYRKAVANVDPWWRIMFGVDDPLQEMSYDIKTAASWFRNVWSPDGVTSSDKTIKEFLFG